MSNDRIRVCFVCLGNICRSPTAEGIMRHLVDKAGLSEAFLIESAGTGSWHVGQGPDDRACDTARRRGFRLEGQARQFERRDFKRFDYVVAMDASNRGKLESMAPSGEARGKVRMLREFEPGGTGKDVPDPYYGGDDGFEKVFDICEAACRGLLAHIRSEHGL